AVADSDENVRNEGNRLEASLKPDNAITVVADVLQKGSITEKQGALKMLDTIQGNAADKLIADYIGKLIAGTLPKEIELELLQAAGAHRASELVKEKLQEYTASQSTNDEFAGYRETLYGGDAEAGRKIFLERPDASCVRCHQIHGQGGKVGPDLTGIITRHNREYILESILYPNKQIAPGFESVLVEMKNGQSYAGVVKSQDDQYLNIFSVEDNSLVKLKKADIKTQVKGPSPMPEGMGNILSKQDLRNLVEFLATLK
ncbi:MAG TPA: c-type cytochrome, partial [Verrucomicrobiae bacterium]|nr:c-type cytochrome [Verrucomicrobiae bacterium]